MPKAQTRPKTSLKRGLLRAAGWNERTRSALETLIRNGSGKNLPVVLDFDNTIVCGDIADALVAVLAKSKQLTAESIPSSISVCQGRRGDLGELRRYHRIL